MISFQSGKIIQTAALAALVGALVSCNPDTRPMGQLSLRLTDAAVDNAENVYLTISSVTVKGPDGQHSFDFVDDSNEPNPIVTDLLSLTGPLSIDLMEHWPLPAGDYQWVRLDVVTAGAGDSYVVLDDLSEHELTVPSDQLKLVRGFTIPANGSVDFTIDIDLYKSLVQDANGYKLKPVMRMIDNTEVGHISGTVDGTLVAACGADMAVYAFAGTDTELTDVFEDQGPVLAAWVDDSFDNSDMAEFELGYLVPGDYTLHLLCDPADDPLAEDSLAAVASMNISVENGDIASAEFIAPPAP